MVALLRIPPQTKELPLWDEVGGEQVIVGYKTVPAPLFAPGTEPANVIATQEPDVYLCAPMPSSLPVGASVILEYQEDGSVARADLDAYLAIRPLGNEPEGQATGTLRFHHFMGDAPPMLGDRLSPDPIERIYPADNLPLEIVIDHYWYEQAEFSGWGFLAEIVGGAASRDPSVRAMAVYSDSEHTQYLWTGGAFQQGSSRLGQVDDQGNPLTVWFSDTPPGFRTQTKTPWNLAVLWASVQEGTCILTPD